MSDADAPATADDAADSPSLAKRVYRTVTPEYVARNDTEMTAIGLAYFLVLVVLLVPLLPFMVIVWLVSKLFERASP